MRDAGTGQPPDSLERQLTLGECLALARYAPAELDHARGRVSIARALAMIDAMEVCTTCGWSRELHTARPDGWKVIHMCAQFTRDLCTG